MKELAEVIVMGSGFYAIAVVVGYQRGRAWGIYAGRGIILRLVKETLAHVSGFAKEASAIACHRFAPDVASEIEASWQGTMKKILASAEKLQAERFEP